MTTELIAIAFRVEGRVQGVGFRHFTHRAALRLGVRGWVKNMSDGTVLTHAVGTAAQMAAFRQDLAQGPSYGRVDGLTETSLDPADMARYLDFQVTH